MLQRDLTTKKHIFQMVIIFKFLFKFVKSFNAISVFKHRAISTTKSKFDAVISYKPVL